MLTQSNVIIVLTKEVIYVNKKTLLLGAAVLCITFAGGFAAGNFTKPDIKNSAEYANYRNRRKNNRRNTPLNPETEKQRIEIDEKRLEIEKELSKNEPDWGKIEEMNLEIELKIASERTEYLKQLKQQENNG